MSFIAGFMLGFVAGFVTMLIITVRHRGIR